MKAETQVSEQFEKDLAILIESQEPERTLLISRLTRKYGIKKDFLIHQAFLLSDEMMYQQPCPPSAKQFFHYVLSVPAWRKKIIQFEMDKIDTAWKFDIEKEVIFLRKNPSCHIPIPSTSEELGASFLYLLNEVKTDIRGFAEMIEYYHDFCPIVENN